MRVVPESHEFLFLPEAGQVLSTLELAGRTCYKSEHKIHDESAARFVANIVKSGHLSVIEHACITARLICDRGVSHELVRHRLASYSQESTRYANYAKDRFGGEITVIRPFFWADDSEKYRLWVAAMEAAEKAYLALIAAGARPEEARSVLPNSLKTEVVMTANLREWRHVFALRCSPAAHPQIRRLLLPLLDELNQRLPMIFQDLYEEFAPAIAAIKG